MGDRDADAGAGEGREITDLGTHERDAGGEALEERHGEGLSFR